MSAQLHAALTDDTAEAALALGLDERARRLALAALAAVCERGEVRAFAAHGHPRADDAPTTRDTVFRIASMSKSFLAATVLALRDRGLIDLHAPITEYLPSVRLHHRGHEATVTGEQLLSNRSGLGEDNAWVDRHLGVSRAEIAALCAAGVPLAAAPGTTYQYSNLGQSLLGRVVEVVTGRPVDDVVRETLLEPLGLRRTAHTADGYAADALAGGFRTFDEGGSFTPEPFVGSGALGCIGSMFSTVDDIAAWMWFLGSAFGDDPVAPDVLAPASRIELQQPRTPIPVPSGMFDGRNLAGAGYGYGLFVEEDQRFGRVVQHSGGLPGFSSHMRWHAATGVGVVAFGNSDEFGARRVAGTALGELLRRIEAPSAVVRPWRETVTAARAIDAAILAGRPATEYPFLAGHVLADVPAPVRDARLAAQLEEVGGLAATQAPFAERVVRAADEAELRWRIAGARADLRVEVRLVGLPEPRVQGLATAVVPRGETRIEGELPAPADRHRVELPAD
ncbi:serine hydrolase [Microbacterium sp. p3-SID336]|uniref:serine hydrolase domain-containing protein n=1 Tax=Microbacterium sp. p3-SID336 TaxID=2916212 RepID=UPI0021A3237E|nr:serine hydrolase domain-containing protein [Microbacterium sp. p3-SID336]MCT1478555.1 beta-lactamase family protein [Microbacterium sp. p3-SID336]